MFTRLCLPTNKSFCGAEPTQKAELTTSLEREVGLDMGYYAPTCAIFAAL